MLCFPAVQQGKTGFLLLLMFGVIRLEWVCVGGCGCGCCIQDKATLKKKNEKPDNAYTFSTFRFLILF